MYSMPPDPPRSYNKPSKPYCLSAYSNTCSQWEIDSYISDVEDYIEDLNDYIQEAQRFANAAINFANEAVDYAKCEARDAQS